MSSDARIFRGRETRQVDAITGEPAAGEYPAHVAAEVAARRPDLCAGDAVAAVLTTDPTLTADQVIDLLDEAAEEWAAEQAHERGQE